MLKVPRGLLVLDCREAERSGALCVPEPLLEIALRMTGPARGLSIHSIKYKVMTAVVAHHGGMWTNNWLA